MIIFLNNVLLFKNLKIITIKIYIFNDFSLYIKNKYIFNNIELKYILF